MTFTIVNMCIFAIENAVLGDRKRSLLKYLCLDLCLGSPSFRFETISSDKNKSMYPFSVMESSIQFVTEWMASGFEV